MQKRRPTYKHAVSSRLRKLAISALNRLSMRPGIPKVEVLASDLLQLCDRHDAVMELLAEQFDKMLQENKKK